MTDQAFDAALASPTSGTRLPARALAPTAAFWFAMFVASALGTNIGDYWADNLGLGLQTSFVSLAVICGLMIWGDRENGHRTEIFYWLAIISLRAVATNVGDYATHVLGMNYLLAAIVIGALTLVLGCFTRAGPAGSSPRIDLRYWGAMFAGGVFGTIGGDLVAHTIGLFLAAVILGVLLLAVIRIRNRAAPTAVVGYWCVVLAERAAGTPMGDWLAKSRGLNLGLPVSMAIVTAVLLAVLWARARAQPTVDRGVGAIAAVAMVLPGLRLALLILSVIGSVFMLRIFLVQHPGDPTLVLAYGGGLAVNALYLGWQELTAPRSWRVARLATLWATVKRTELEVWARTKEAELRNRAG